MAVRSFVREHAALKQPFPADWRAGRSRSESSGRQRLKLAVRPISETGGPKCPHNRRFFLSEAPDARAGASSNNSWGAESAYASSCDQPEGFQRGLQMIPD